MLSSSIFLKKLNTKDLESVQQIFSLKIIDFKTNTLIKFDNLREFSRETILTFFLKLICPNIVLHY